jgi:hypothetical protein
MFCIDRGKKLDIVTSTSLMVMEAKYFIGIYSFCQVLFIINQGIRAVVGIRLLVIVIILWPFSLLDLVYYFKVTVFWT